MRLITCPTCGRVFPKNWLLSQHIKNHSVDFRTELLFAILQKSLEHTYNSHVKFLLDNMIQPSSIVKKQQIKQLKTDVLEIVANNLKIKNKK